MSKFASSAITWFEIPAMDLERATKFYEQVLDMTLRPLPNGEPGKFFPVEEGGIGGCLVQRSLLQPSAEGSKVFLNADGKMDASLKRAEALGARITVPRTEVAGGFGYFACLIDSEGNQIGLHTRAF
jgi:predicted enzyme related to lactoylglutathione lyase